MKIKHITIINQYIGSPYHGMEYRHYFLAKNLIGLGYKVTLISGSYSHLFSSPPKFSTKFMKETIDGIEYIWIKVPKYSSSKSIGRIWNMFYFAWKLRMLYGKVAPSHILVSSPSLFPIKTGYKWSRKFNTKCLLEVRDIWPQTLMELSNISSLNPLIKIMNYYERFAYKKADKVISLLPNAQEHYVSQGMKREKFVYLPNGIEVKEKQVTLTEYFESKIPKNKFIIGYCGTLGIANNLDYLIDVAELLRDNQDVHFILLGNGGEKRRLMDRVEYLQLKNVTFLDAVPKDMVFAFLAKIDVAFISLLPKRLFRFGVSPNKVFDYMYANKPILWAIDAGNDLVKEANCGVSVPLKQVEVLKNAILSLHKLEKTRLKELGQNGYNFVITNHSYETLAKKLIKIIEE